MNIEVRKYEAADAAEAVEIWNTVIKDGKAFAEEECLDIESGREFFAKQTHTGVAYDCGSGQLVGVYILHPNFSGRCGHICNASYAVKKELRGQHIGEKLVKDCKLRAHEYGFRILQFNAVVKSNYAALHLYGKLGFKQLGVIPGGFRMDGGHYEDIIPHYCEV